MIFFYDLKDKVKKRIFNNIGGAEIVSIVLIIIVVIGFAALFKTELTELLNNWFTQISTKAKQVA